MDELRNIKVEKVGSYMFAVPKDYKVFDASALVMEPGEQGTSRPENNQVESNADNRR